MPPPRKPVSIGKILGVAAALIALGSGAWFATHALDSARPAATPHVAVSAPHAVPASHADAVPAPVQPAPVVEASAPAAPAVVAAVSAPEAPSAASATAYEHVQALPQRRATENADDALHAALAQAGTVAAPVATVAPAAPSETTPTATETPAAPAAPAVAAAEPAAAPADVLGALPDLPSREEIVAGFEQARVAIDTCAGGKHGLVKIDATIANSGRVANAIIGGVFVGTPEGSCIARAVRAAHFPPFSQQSLKISYPIAPLSPRTTRPG